jgi:choline-sulfatase
LFKDHGDDWENWKKSMAVYWGYCTMMDDLVGKLLRELEDQQVLNDTLVIFISDHGELLGSHGLWQKMMPYEEALRVPMLMRMPGKITPGIRSRANVSLIDIAPTILSIVGEEVPLDMIGRDLSPCFEDGAEFQADPYRFSEHKPLGEWHQAVEWRLVTDNHFKYVWNQGDMDELYDLVTDPNECYNLIYDRDYSQKLEQLQDRLFKWMLETKDPILRPFPLG